MVRVAGVAEAIVVIVLLERIHRCRAVVEGVEDSVGIEVAAGIALVIFVGVDLVRVGDRRAVVKRVDEPVPIPVLLSILLPDDNPTRLLQKSHLSPRCHYL